MADTTDTTDATEKPARTSLRLPGHGPGHAQISKLHSRDQVKQTFNRGKSKTVTVEVKRRRTYAPGEGGHVTEIKAPDLVAVKMPKKAIAAEARAEPVPTARELTQEERHARMRALEEAQKHAEALQVAIAAKAAEAPTLDAGDVGLPAENVEQQHINRAEEQRQVEDGARLEIVQEARRQADDEAVRRLDIERRRVVVEPTPAAPEAATPERESETARRGKARVAPGRAPARGRVENRRQTGKLTISKALEDDSGRTRSVAAFRRRMEKERRARASPAPAQKIVREVVTPESITVSELANRMAERSSEVIKALIGMGVMVTINDDIDQDTAELVISEFGHTIKRVSAADVEIGLGGAPDADEGTRVARPPVVTIMGHVDHGKTSLLDALRETDVVSREAGGITQHIGAYQVKIGSGAQITFIDTPGHEAFTSMRQRGAQATDIVILVVAADDGVRPQTVEAISHARAAGVPIIVAINKCDRPQANPDRVKQELLRHEIVVEDMGGEVQTIAISALKKQGLDKLEEAIVLQAELLELKANPDRMATGVVIEAKLERGRGPVATVLVQSGTLRVGDILVAGPEWGRVRALINDKGKPVAAAGPSMPVEVLGLNAAPQAGDALTVVENETRAREVSEFRTDQQRDQRVAVAPRGTLEEMMSRLAEGEAAEVPIVVKADVQGSVEAIVGALTKLETDEVKTRFLHAAVGGITESDVSLASASGGIIIGFNVRPNPPARQLAKRDSVEIRHHSIIYNVIADVTALMSGKLSPAYEETAIGTAEIREVFIVTKVGKVAGCMVTGGVIRRGCKARLVRDGTVIYTGGLSTLKRFKDDVREVRDGYECGLSLENYGDIHAGDTVECFEVKEIARTI